MWGFFSSNFRVNVDEDFLRWTPIEYGPANITASPFKRNSSGFYNSRLSTSNRTNDDSEDSSGDENDERPNIKSPMKKTRKVSKKSSVDEASDDELDDEPIVGQKTGVKIQKLKAVSVQKRAGRRFKGGVKANKLRLKKNNVVKSEVVAAKGILNQAIGRLLKQQKKKAKSRSRVRVPIVNVREVEDELVEENVSENKLRKSPTLKRTNNRVRTSIPSPIRSQRAAASKAIDRIAATESQESDSDIVPLPLGRKRLKKKAARRKLDLDENDASDVSKPKIIRIRSASNSPRKNPSQSADSEDEEMTLAQKFKKNPTKKIKI